MVRTCQERENGKVLKRMTDAPCSTRTETEGKTENRWRDSCKGDMESEEIWKVWG